MAEGAPGGGRRRAAAPTLRTILLVAAVAPLVLTMIGGAALPRAGTPFFVSSAPPGAPAPGALHAAAGESLDVSVVATPPSGPAPLTVNFSGAVTNGTPPYGINWDFGDSTPWGQGLNVSHTFAGAGTYYVVAHGYDALNSSGSEEVTVTVAPGSGALQVSVAATPTQGPAPLDATFWANATGGSPPYTISWTFGDGGNGSSSPIHYTYASAGSFVAQATVRDGAGASVSGRVTVDVGESGNEDLALALIPTPSHGSAPLQVDLNATAVGGTPPYSLSVCFPDAGCRSGPSGWTGAPAATFTQLFSVAGTFTVTGLVTDADGESAAASASVTVGPESPLSAQVNVTPLSGEAPLTVSLVASVSGGTVPYALEWSFGDGSLGTAVPGVAVHHTYERSGTFVPTLSVTDFVGHTASVGAAPVQVAVNPHTEGITIPRVGALGATIVPYAAIEVAGAVAVGALLGWVVWRRESRRRLKRQGEAIVHQLEADRGPNGPT